MPMPNNSVQTEETTVNIGYAEVQYSFHLTADSAVGAVVHPIDGVNWFCLLIDFTHYGLAPMSAETDDPARWQWAVSASDQLLDAAARLRAARRLAGRFLCDAVYIAPDVAGSPYTDLAVVPRFEADSAALYLLNGHRTTQGASLVYERAGRVVRIEQIDQLALVWALDDRHLQEYERESDALPGEFGPDRVLYLLHADSLADLPTVYRLRRRYGDTLSTNDLINETGFNQHTIYRAIRLGELRATHQGRGWTITAEDAAAFIDSPRKGRGRPRKTKH